MSETIGERLARSMVVIQYNHVHDTKGEFASGGDGGGGGMATGDGKAGGKDPHVKEVHQAQYRGLKEIKKPGGGFSISMKDGSSPPFMVPGAGYMVAHRLSTNSVKTERLHAAKDITLTNIHNHSLVHHDLLMKPHMYQGGWNEEEKGKAYAYLDVSEHVKTRAEAVRLGKREKQKAILNLTTGDPEYL